MDEKIQQVLDELESNLQEIDGAVKHIEKAGKVSKEVTDSVKEIQGSFKDSIAQIEQLLADKEKGREEQFNQHLSSVQSKMDGQFHKIDEFLSEKEKLIQQVEELKDFINSVDFPNRLDKLDNTTSSITLSLQNLQTAISDFKKDIQAEQQKLSEKQDKIQNTLWVCLEVLGS